MVGELTAPGIVCRLVSPTRIAGRLEMKPQFPVDHTPRQGFRRGLPKITKILLIIMPVLAAGGQILDRLHLLHKVLSPCWIFEGIYPDIINTFGLKGGF